MVEPVVAAHADLTGSSFSDLALNKARFGNVNLSDTAFDNVNPSVYRNTK